MDPVVDSAYRKKTKKDPKVNQKVEGKIVKFDGEEAIRPQELIAFKFSSKKQLINIETHEFSAVCPFSGLPDIARLIIKYLPSKGYAVELKSLKYYFLSFRSAGVYQERVTELIYKHIKKCIKADTLYVKSVYNTRGGIDVICEEGDFSLKNK